MFCFVVFILFSRPGYRRFTVYCHHHIPISPHRSLTSILYARCILFSRCSGYQCLLGSIIEAILTNFFFSLRTCLHYPPFYHIGYNTHGTKRSPLLRRRLKLLQSNRPPQHRHRIPRIKRKRRITVPNDIPMPRRDHIRIAPRATRIQRSNDVVRSSLCHCERTRIQLCGVCEIDIIVRVRSGVGALTERRRQRAPFLCCFFAVGGRKGRKGRKNVRWGKVARFGVWRAACCRRWCSTRAVWLRWLKLWLLLLLLRL